MIMFDIGANRGDAVVAGLNKGYKVIAVEPAPKIFSELVKNFIYNKNVVPLKFAVSDSDGKRINFYECVEDGLSTTEESWLTQENMPYKGKEYRTISATTITLDTLASIYGEPDLVKIDVEGAEWSVFRGMTKHHGKIAFEWTDATIEDHRLQLEYLKFIGYKKVAPQFIVNHLEEPEDWYLIEDFCLDTWVANNKNKWENGGWKTANLRPTADVGMVWID